MNSGDLVLVYSPGHPQHLRVGELKFYRNRQAFVEFEGIADLVRLWPWDLQPVSTEN